MKTDLTTASVSLSCSPADSTKLASLLALAAGAIAMPQTGNAEIVYTDLSSSPKQVGWTGGAASYLLQLPGTVLFGFQRFQQTLTTTTPFTSTFFVRGVIAADMYGAATARIQEGPGGFAAPQTYGVAWNQGGFPLVYTVTMGAASTSNRTPSSGYDHQYLGFRFRDSTAGNAFRYGWIEVGLTMGLVNPFPSPSGGPNVTIYGYGWDNTGAQPTMGQKPAVPEPTSAALLMIGALALGAPGLRKWRQNRTAGNS